MSVIPFSTYDAENPHLYLAFVKFAREAKAKGFTAYSAKGIFEIIRWHTGAQGNDQFKLNNNYHADYARKLMTDFPSEFAGFFRTREMKADRT